MSLPVPAMALLGPSEINELVLGVDHLVGRVFSSKGASIHPQHVLAGGFGEVGGGRGALGDEEVAI